MSEYADRFKRIAADFSRRVDAVPAEAWDNPAPCEGWLARDVVGHLVEWVPSFLQNYAGVDLPSLPATRDDPVKAWHELREALEATLADEAVSAREFDNPGGRMTVGQAIDQLITNDVFLHTWDLARATGLDETLDPGEARQMLAGMEQYDEALRSSGQYGPRVEVPDDADDQTKLIAFIGRHP